MIPIEQDDLGIPIDQVELLTTSCQVDLVDLVTIVERRDQVDLGAIVDRGDQVDLFGTALCQEAGARGSRRDRSRRLQGTCREKPIYGEQFRTTGYLETQLDSKTQIPS